MAARRTAERSVQLIGRLSKRDFTRSFSFTSLIPSRATWWNALSAHACCHFGAVEQTSGTIQHLRREAMVHLPTLKKTTKKQNRTMSRGGLDSNAFQHLHKEKSLFASLQGGDCTASWGANNIHWKTWQCEKERNYYREQNCCQLLLFHICNIILSFQIIIPHSQTWEFSLHGQKKTFVTHLEPFQQLHGGIVKIPPCYTQLYHEIHLKSVPARCLRGKKQLGDHMWWHVMEQNFLRCFLPCRRCCVFCHVLSTGRIKYQHSLLNSIWNLIWFDWLMYIVDEWFKMKCCIVFFFANKRLSARHFLPVPIHHLSHCCFSLILGWTVLNQFQHPCATFCSPAVHRHWVSAISLPVPDMRTSWQGCWC